MGAYREQLLRETYGNKAHSFMEPEGREPSGSLAVFKLKFTVSLFLFAGFVYLGMTGNSFCNVTAEQIVEAVTEADLYVQLSELGLYEPPAP
ncbi:MAG: hypothetical protein HFI14_01740 [Lachnospiraceae bacterium]|nr:hypothetical protein [Lachnospiraceae bacterium]